MTRFRRPPTPREGRVIHNIEFDQGVAKDRAAYLKEQERHPRIYLRSCKAEGITVWVYVVVCDVLRETYDDPDGTRHIGVPLPPDPGS